jgi:ADP-ribose pyrophosphatase YjhB (NUDIX family)
VRRYGQPAIPEGDSLPRHVCQRCGTIHYLNPKLVVGCIAEWQDQILLCRRSIAPRYGLWTLPAGFMENGESTTQAAIRETLEEACARVEIEQLFSLVNVPHINQVHLFYRARLLDTDFAAGLETLETALFCEDAVPWQVARLPERHAVPAGLFFRPPAGRFVRFHEDDLPPPAAR